MIWEETGDSELCFLGRTLYPKRTAYEYVIGVEPAAGSGPIALQRPYWIDTPR